MSMAWEVTKTDIRVVLGKHGIKDEGVIETAWNIVCDESDTVEDAVLYYTDMDDQVYAALDEIENILIENGVLEGEKQFVTP